MGSIFQRADPDQKSRGYLVTWNAKVRLEDDSMRWSTGSGFHIGASYDEVVKNIKRDVLRLQPRATIESFEVMQFVKKS